MNKLDKKSLIPILLTVGGVLSLVAAMLIIPRSKTAHPISTGESPTDSHIEENYPEIPRVSLVDSKAGYDGGTAVFLDVRDAGSFASSHIPGAVNIPSDKIQNRMAELDREDWIITYCT